MATTHVVYSYYTVLILVLYSACDHENNQSTHIYMYEPNKNSKTVTTHSRFWRPHIYYCCCSGAKKKSLTLSHGPKTPLVACVFYLVLLCTCFWLNVNRYTCFWHLPFKLLVVRLQRQWTDWYASGAGIIPTHSPIHNPCIRPNPPIR